MLNKKSQTKIMVFGTFDGLHAGHINFFRQAKKLSKNSFLIVSIARDRNVKRIKKVFPHLNEKKRMTLVKKCVLVDKVVLSGMNKYITHIVREHPDIIALGYDQNFYVPNLKKDLKSLSAQAGKGLLVKIVRLKPYKEKIFKSHLLKKKM